MASSICTSKELVNGGVLSVKCLTLRHSTMKVRLGADPVTLVYTPLSARVVFCRSSQLGAIMPFGRLEAGIQILENEAFAARAPSVMKPLLLMVPVM